MIIEGEETFFGESITNPEEFIKDLCDRVDGMYVYVMNEERKTLQLKAIQGFIRAFKGRLSRVCKKQDKKVDANLINSDRFLKDESELIFEEE